MKIKRITVWHVPLTSHATYYMAAGKQCATVTTVVVRLETDTPHVGWGEVCNIPGYLPAYAGGVAPVIEELTPTLIGADPVGPEALMARLDAVLKGHVYAKSALDIALWDLTGKAAGLPLYQLLGGCRTTSLPLYHSITCVAPDEMARIARDAYDKGMRQIQVKLGADDDWQTDAERLIKVREAVGDRPLVYGDWNCGASQLDAIRTGRAVAHLDIMLEQPCETIAGCAAVKAATGLPMKLDESAHDTATLLEAHDRQCLDAVAVKLSKFGGVSASRRARDLCQYLGAKMCVEDTWGSDITMSAAMHLATASDPAIVLNVCDLSGYVAPRLDPTVPSRDGAHISIPQGPGLGVNPDADVLGQPLAMYD